MIKIQIVVGLICLIMAILNIVFRHRLSKSHWITVPGGFGGKSFEEKFGIEKAPKIMFLFGLIFLILGFALFLTGILGVDISNN